MMQLASKSCTPVSIVPRLLVSDDPALPAKIGVYEQPYFDEVVGTLFKRTTDLPWFDIELVGLGPLAQIIS